MNFRIITVKKRSPILFTVCLKSFLPIRSLRAFPVKRNCFMDFCLTVMQLSIKNRWLDEEGKVYIYFSQEQISGMMGCGLKKVGNLLAEA